MDNLLYVPYFQIVQNTKRKEFNATNMSPNFDTLGCDRDKTTKLYFKALLILNIDQNALNRNWKSNRKTLLKALLFIMSFF